MDVVLPRSPTSPVDKPVDPQPLLDEPDRKKGGIDIDIDIGIDIGIGIDVGIGIGIGIDIGIGIGVGGVRSKSGKMNQQR